MCLLLNKTRGLAGKTEMLKGWARHSRSKGRGTRWVPMLPGQGIWDTDLSRIPPARTGLGTVMALSAGGRPRCRHGNRCAGGARLSRAGTCGDTAWQSHWPGTRAARATGEAAWDTGCETHRGHQRGTPLVTATGPPAGDKASRFERAIRPPAGKPDCGAAGRVPLSPGSVTAPPRSLSAALASLTCPLRCVQTRFCSGAGLGAPLVPLVSRWKLCL